MESFSEWVKTQSEKDQRYRFPGREFLFRVSASSLLEDGWEEVRNYFLGAVVDENDKEYFPKIEKESDIFKKVREEIGGEWLTTKGTFPKRFARMYHKLTKIRLDQKIISRIGQIARAHCPTQKEMQLCITSCTMCWEAGTYGDGDSCFFGNSTNAIAREIMNDDPDFYAVLLHREDGAPESRCWLNTLSPGWGVIFNAYTVGSNHLLQLARILGTLSGFHYRRVVLRGFNGYDGDDYSIYINDDKGYRIGPYDEIALVDKVHLEWNRR